MQELLSREAKSFDPTVTLLWEDVKVEENDIEGKTVVAGQRIEVFETGTVMCPYKAFKK